jgi:hypothetical protein
MDRIRADLRQLDKLNIAQQSVPLVGSPRRSVASVGQRPVLRAAVDIAADINAQAGYLKEPFKIAQHPPSTTIFPPTTVPVGLTASSGSAFTLGCGLNVDVFAVVGAVLQGGIYGSTTPELGVFLSVGGGWWTNVGVGVGPVITFIFGPPSDLAGVAFGIGCDVGFMAGSVGGLILFSPPPFRFLGFAVGVAFGPTSIPAFDVTVQVTDTFTRPLLK